MKRTFDFLTRDFGYLNLANSQHSHQRNLYTPFVNSHGPSKRLCSNSQQPLRPFQPPWPLQPKGQSDANLQRSRHVLPATLAALTGPATGSARLPAAPLAAVKPSTGASADSPTGSLAAPVTAAPAAAAPAAAAPPAAAPPAAAPAPALTLSRPSGLPSSGLLSTMATAASSCLSGHLRRFVADRESRYREERLKQQLAEERARKAADDARRAAEHAAFEERLRRLAELKSKLEGARSSRDVSRLRGDVDGLTSECSALDERMAALKSALAAADRECADLARELASLMAQGGAEGCAERAAALVKELAPGAALPGAALARRIEAASTAVEGAAKTASALGREARSALERSTRASSELGTLLWRAEDVELSDMLLAQAAESHAEFHPLVAEAARLPLALAAHANAAEIDLTRLSGRSASLQSCAEKANALAAAEAAAASQARASSRPAPPGTRTLARVPLSAEMEDVVDDALSPGHDPREQLVEYQNIPVTRRDIATIRPDKWLNDEVINLFMKLLDARSQAATDAALPKCYFAQTNFYTKLAEGPNGYCYKDVRRWTKKVDVFTKDLLIVPIHCHGNHWTLAVVNFKSKRFEYYDSLFGSEDMVLKHLRRWLEDEHQEKKKAPYDTGEWIDMVWGQASGTPQQRNGSDCGVFMTRTADFLSRDAKLDFSQSEMAYFRRRMVYEILKCELLP